MAAFFLLGLVGSPHCLAMCGPLCFASGTSRLQIVRYQFGRLLAYLGLGSLAGAVGEKALLHNAPLFSWLSVFLFAVALALSLRRFGPALLKRVGPRLSALTVGFRSFAFGLSSALLPCGWLHLVLGAAVLMADPLQGALALVMFWLGSSPLLIWGTQRANRFLRNSRSRWAVAALVLIVTYGTLAAMSRGRWTHADAKSEELFCHGSLTPLNDNKE